MRYPSTVARRSADDESRHQRQVNDAARVMNATPLSRNRADVNSSLSRWCGMSARWTPPVTAIKAAAACTVPGTDRRRGWNRRPTRASGSAISPPMSPMACEALTEYMH